MDDFNFVEHNGFNLTFYEEAYIEAVRRQKTNENLNLSGRNNGPATGNAALQIHILGAIGELAVAEYLNLEKYVFAETNAVRGSFDLPPNIDVKTRSKHWMDLVIQLDDDPSKIFVHATCEDKKVRMHGWTYGHRVMKDNFIKDPAGNRPAYFVREWALHPMHLLKDYISDLRY